MLTNKYQEITYKYGTKVITQSKFVQRRKWGHRDAHTQN